jgi:hypothetical protein
VNTILKNGYNKRYVKLIIDTKCILFIIYYLQIECFVIIFIVTGGVCNERFYDSYKRS